MGIYLEGKEKEVGYGRREGRAPEVEKRADKIKNLSSKVTDFFLMGSETFLMHSLLWSHVTPSRGSGRPSSGTDRSLAYYVCYREGGKIQ